MGVSMASTKVFADVACIDNWDMMVVKIFMYRQLGHDGGQDKTESINFMLSYQNILYNCPKVLHT